MSKIVLHEPVILGQSTTEPIFRGGYQDCYLKCDESGTLLARFAVRHDTAGGFGLEQTHPMFVSTDKGETWTPCNDEKRWIKAMKTLPNGDKLLIREARSIPREGKQLPKAKWQAKGNGYGELGVYLVDDVAPVYPDVKKEFGCARIYAGTDTVVEEKAKINWKNMPVDVDEDFLDRLFPDQQYVVDKNGVLWTAFHGYYVKEDGTLGSNYWSLNLLRSDDFGHTWDYVSTLPYLEEYQNPNCHHLEGFSECSLTPMEDGSLLAIYRSGSLFFDGSSNPEHPAPQIFISHVTDNGKTWSYPKKFYDYGIWPQTVKFPDGKLLMTSGRPGVYVRLCEDGKGDEWTAPIDLVHVPEEDFYRHYHEYSCANSGLALYDDHTAFIEYSNHKIPTPQGERAKTIVVQKITIED